MGDIQRLVKAYDEAFLEEMPCGLDEVDDPAAARLRAEQLPESALRLLDTLLLCTPPLEPVDARFTGSINELGEPLWLNGLLLPRAQPSRGATIDPRHYAASCRLHPGLTGRTPLNGQLPIPLQEHLPQFPPSDARWDAVVLAAALELRKPRLKSDGQLRRDVQDRMFQSLSDEPGRWETALAYARVVGLARPAGRTLCGFPESRPRALVDPLQVASPKLLPAGRALLRLVQTDWIEVAPLLDTLRTQTRALLFSPDANGAYAQHPSAHFDEQGWRSVEEPLLRQAADLLHRIRVFDGARDAHGLVAIRRAQRPPRRPPGFMVTPDMDILVAVGELPLQDYGRLCRLAPFVEGTRVHRHRLSRDGIAADLASGYPDPIAFLASHSRTGVPGGVRNSIEQWTRSAERVVLFTGADLIERDGSLSWATPDDAPDRSFDYAGSAPPAARFHMQDDELVVQTGEDALTVRAAMARVGRRVSHDAERWVWRLSPRPSNDTEGLLETLRRLHATDELPGELEAAVLAANGLPSCRIEEAVVVHLPERVAPALRRDRVVGAMLEREVAPGQCLVSRSHLPALQARFADLGLTLDTQLLASTRR